MSKLLFLMRFRLFEMAKSFFFSSLNPHFRAHQYPMMEETSIEKSLTTKTAKNTKITGEEQYSGTCSSTSQS